MCFLLSLAASYPGSVNKSDLLKTKSAFNNQARHKVLYRATEGMKQSKGDKRTAVIRPLREEDERVLCPWRCSFSSETTRRSGDLIFRDTTPFKKWNLGSKTRQNSDGPLAK